MKISEKTVDILKNFSAININLQVKPGSEIRTVSPQKSMLATAIVEETFDTPFCIYELPKLIGSLSLFKEPDVCFFENHLTIAAGTTVMNYTYAAPAMIIAAPEKNINLTDPDVELSLTEGDLARVVRAAGVLQLPEIAFVGNGKKIFLRAMNNKNPTADQFNIEVGESDKDFIMMFKAENIVRLLSRDYTVRLSTKGISHFGSADVNYWVAIESNAKG